MEPLPQQLRPHLRGRLRRRLLQLQVGGGARGGCFCRIRGTRGVRPADRAAISRCDLEPRRQPRRTRGVHRVSRPTPGRDGAAPATRHTRPGRDPRVRRRLAALAAALLLLCALAPQRSRAEELYVIERSEEHTSELQSRLHLVCRLLLEKKKNNHDASDNLIGPNTHQSFRTILYLS